jgi:DNA repair exonuclease SbcCD ATPase subunit
MASLTLSLVEIIVLMLGAITLGITIHFFIASRRSFKEVKSEAEGKTGKELEGWKLKYFNDIEVRDKEMDLLRHRLSESEENNTINTIEADEMRKANKRLLAEMDALRKTAHSHTGEKPGQNELREKEFDLLRKRLSEAEENNTINTIEADEMRKQNKRLLAEMDELRKATHPYAMEKTGQNELREKEFDLLRQRLSESEENNTINTIEAEELRKQNKRLLAEIESLRKAPQQPVVTGEKPGYIDQLREAQSSLMEHNEKINHLLGQIDIVKETEEKQQEIMKNNEELSNQVDDLKMMLSQKEKEMNNIRQKAQLTKEMTSMLDNAYSEFSGLQDKIQKLETQIAASKKISMEHEDLKENYYKVTKDFDEHKMKFNAITTENQELHRILTDTEEKLRETSFQRQQLQKRVAYLEELNNDMQAVVDANKKLEGQLKRIGELESMLNVIAEERDELAKKHYKSVQEPGH